MHSVVCASCAILTGSKDGRERVKLAAMEWRAADAETKQVCGKCFHILSRVMTCFSSIFLTQIGIRFTLPEVPTAGTWRCGEVCRRVQKLHIRSFCQRAAGFQGYHCTSETGKERASPQDRKIFSQLHSRVRKEKKYFVSHMYKYCGKWRLHPKLVLAVTERHIPFCNHEHAAGTDLCFDSTKLILLFMVP